MINKRQRQAIKSALDSVVRAIDTYNNNTGFIEVVSHELQQVLNNIGLVDGKFLDEDIIDRIFSQFCIGK